jgi:hypothetical protein
MGPHTQGGRSKGNPQKDRNRRMAPSRFVDEGSRGQHFHRMQLRRGSKTRCCLSTFCFLNREHLERKFGNSTQQASIDLNAFMRDHPGVMRYNKAAKRYVTILTPEEIE